MKKILILGTIIVVLGINANGAGSWHEKGKEPKPAKYESFENGVPTSWILTGQGKLSTSPWHYKLGKNSLQWDFKVGDVITINNTLGDTQLYKPLPGGPTYTASFGVWLYAEQPMPGKNLEIDFCTGNKCSASFVVPLNFKGWQYAGTSLNHHYLRILRGNLDPKTDNIRLKAPSNSDGRIFIDLMVYNGPHYGWYSNVIPNQKPWRAPVLDEKKYPVPSSISAADKKTVEHIKKILLFSTAKSNGAQAFKRAMDIINSFNIVVDEHGVRGKPINTIRTHSTGEVQFYTCNGIDKAEIETINEAIIYDGGSRWPRGAASKIFKAVSWGINRQQYDILAEASMRMWKFLLDQGFNTSAGFFYYHPMSYVPICRALYVMRNELIKAGLMDELFQYAQYRNLPLFIDKPVRCSMDYFQSCKTLFYLAFLYGNTPEREVQALRSLKDRLSNEIVKDSGKVGFKPDGCGFHTGEFLHPYFVGGLAGISEAAYMLNGSSMALTDEAYEVLKRCAWRMYFNSAEGKVPLFLQGDKPFFRFNSTLYPLPNILRNLALAGKGGCDKELAQAYVNLKEAMKNNLSHRYDDIFEKKYGLKPTALPVGNISMPYAPLLSHRRNNWVATAWGGIASITERGNHYGISFGCGPLEIIGKDDWNASGNQENGFDWNRTAGATVVYIPDIINIKSRGYKLNGYAGYHVPANKKRLGRIVNHYYKASKDDPWITRGDGGISWRGMNGCFRKVIDSDKIYNDFNAKKSYFFINERIYALGSSISSKEEKYHIQTNLYQKAIKPNDNLYMDRTEKSTHIIDPVGNGYYVPKGQHLYTARKHQKSRTSNYTKNRDHEGDFATAWLDHGIKCKNAKYCYVIFPYCDKGKFEKFSDQDFEVLQQDDFAHILHDKIDEFYAGIFFKGGDVKNLPYVKNVERDCQIMYKENNNRLEIVVGDPDTNRHWRGGKSVPKPLKVLFIGEWALEKPVKGVKILEVKNGKTTTEFACIHGKDFNFTLIKQGSRKRRNFY